MNYDTACRQAKQLAMKHQALAYDVLDGSLDYDGEYEAATEYDLETFFLGCQIIIAFDCDGSVAGMYN
jgi:hypothetical protein